MTFLSLAKRAVRKVARELSPAEREFRRVWPLIDSVEGHLVPGQERWLFDIARSLPDGANLVEVGSFKGRSTCSLGFGCRGSKKRIFAVDSFNGNDWDFADRGFLPVFLGNVERCGLSEYIEPVVGFSTEVAETWNKPIQFLFIDGSHRYEDVLADYAGFLPHVVVGGVIAFHDVVETWPGPMKAWQEDIKQQLSDIGYCSTIAYGRKPATPPEART